MGRSHRVYPSVAAKEDSDIEVSAELLPKAIRMRMDHGSPWLVGDLVIRHNELCCECHILVHNYRLRKSAHLLEGRPLDRGTDIREKEGFYAETGDACLTLDN